MGQKMTWEEMKKAYPDEWLLVTDYETDQFGQVKVGIVERHSKKMADLANPPVIDRNTAFRYTGESTFAGLRSHAKHHTI